MGRTGFVLNLAAHITCTFRMGPWRVGCAPLAWVKQTAVGRRKVTNRSGYRAPSQLVGCQLGPMAPQYIHICWVMLVKSTVWDENLLTRFSA